MPGWSAAVAIVLLGLLVAPSAEARRIVDVSLRAPATNGYTFLLQAEGSRHDYVDATFAQSRRFGLYSRSRGVRVGARRVRADLGEVGRIRLRFHAKRVRKFGAPCTTGRRAPKIKRGVFRGRLRITGENGYARIDETKLKGRILVHHGGQVCPFPSSGDGAHGREVDRRRADRERDLALVSCGPRRGLGLAYYGDSDSDLYLAALWRSVGAVSSVRQVYSIARRGSFRHNRSETRANFRPPGPFSGRGHYEHHRLTGTLRAGIPGIAGGAPLTPARAEFGSDVDLGFCPLSQSRDAPSARLPTRFLRLPAFARQ